MNDPVLEDRLRALEEDLTKVGEPEPAYDTYPQAFVFDTEVWYKVEESINQAARDLITDLGELRNLTDEQAWNRYKDLYVRAQNILRDSLEFLGALALRNTLQDREICRIADEMIKYLRNATVGPLSVTVPASETMLTRLTWIVRLQLPGWTIWTLPIAAHTYGHFGLATLPRLAPESSTSRIAAWIGDNLKAQGIAPREEKKARQNAEKEAYILLADAFATYTMGPAYASCAILLHFDPYLRRPEPGYPSDAQRVHVILGMLKAMDLPDGSPEQMYSDVIDDLRKKWQDMLTKAGQPIALDGEEVARLDKFIGLAWSGFDGGFKRFALYRHDPTWIAKIRRQMEHPDEEPEVKHNDDLRAVLNAAWSVRRLDREHASQIAAAAETMCIAILEAPPQQQTGGRRAVLEVPQPGGRVADALQTRQPSKSGPK